MAQHKPNGDTNFTNGIINKIYEIKYQIFLLNNEF